MTYDHDPRDPDPALSALLVARRRHEEQEVARRARQAAEDANLTDEARRVPAESRCDDCDGRGAETDICGCCEAECSACDGTGVAKVCAG